MHRRKTENMRVFILHLKKCFGDEVDAATSEWERELKETRAMHSKN